MGTHIEGTVTIQFSLQPEQIAEQVARSGYDIVKELGKGDDGIALLVVFNGGFFEQRHGKMRPHRQLQRHGQEQEWNVPSALPLRKGGFRLTDENYVPQTPGKQAVLKMMDLRPNPNAVDRPADLTNEVRAMVAVRSHPYITKIFDAFTIHEDILCVVMEYGELGTLLALAHSIQAEKDPAISAKMAIPTEMAIHWLLQIILAIHYVHHKGWEHNDMHAGNTFLFISDDHFGVKAKLGDFGIAENTGMKYPDEQGARTNQLRDEFDYIWDCTTEERDTSAVLLNIRGTLSPDVSVADLLRQCFDFNDVHLKLNAEGKLDYKKVVRNGVVRWEWTKLLTG